MALFGSLTPARGAPAQNTGVGPYTEFDRLFDTMLARGFGVPATFGGSEGLKAITPRLDVSETDKAYIIAAELPGVEQKDISVDLTEGVLTISGEKKAETEESGKTWHRVERRYGSFSRALSLPADADEAAITAEMENGLLTVTIGKTTQAQTKARKIDVKTK